MRRKTKNSGKSVSRLGETNLNSIHLVSERATRSLLSSLRNFDDFLKLPRKLRKTLYVVCRIAEYKTGSTVYVFLYVFFQRSFVYSLVYVDHDLGKCNLASCTKDIEKASRTVVSRTSKFSLLCRFSVDAYIS